MPTPGTPLAVVVDSSKTADWSGLCIDSIWIEGIEAEEVVEEVDMMFYCDGGSSSSSSGRKGREKEGKGEVSFNIVWGEDWSETLPLFVFIPVELLSGTLIEGSDGIDFVSSVVDSIYPLK